MNTFSETLYDAYSQIFNIDKLYYENKTDHQHLIIFHNAIFGRVMVLDGIVQTTEKDEFIYHEMLTHVPILSHGNAKNILIIGGGDGGILREVAKHQAIKKITKVEIDDKVIEMCKQYLPNHSQGAFDDPRLNLVINDGMEFLKKSNEQFDIIISDSTDPIGPGEVLFSDDFYAACKSCLTPDGILVTQNGVPFMQPDELTNTAKKLNQQFADGYFYSAAIPTYIGGIMTFGWGTNNISHRKIDLNTLEARYAQANISTQYYNPAIHQASFALPQYVINQIKDA